MDIQSKSLVVEQGDIQLEMDILVEEGSQLVDTMLDLAALVVLVDNKAAVEEGILAAEGDIVVVQVLQLVEDTALEGDILVEEGIVEEDIVEEDIVIVEVDTAVAEVDTAIVEGIPSVERIHLAVVLVETQYQGEVMLRRCLLVVHRQAVELLEEDNQIEAPGVDNRIV